ncbi:MAG: protein-methionine-sulfoxide reductase catalytic subunit MsrP [Chloroflexi bacterium]|nr:protein-methionine-sulfoxide reductase catalytic subunit MsrP [Chloroflexota bacterium]
MDDRRLRDEITPEPVYRRRHAIMRAAGVLPMIAMAGLVGCGAESAPATSTPETPRETGASADAGVVPTPGYQEILTPFESVTSYNNFYEFSTDKEGVAKLAQGFKTSPWTLSVGGLVDKPQTFTVEDLDLRFNPEERVYRLRCVEGWSMVIPWQGFPISRILDAVVPKGDAKFLKFETVKRPDEMPGMRGFSPYAWPYVEGLTLDEARNPLATIATGLYGKPLLAQNGAPVRLVVPWKYGFKSIKSIVKIELVAQQPTSLWMAAAPSEYGFFANVNPEVSHPRWSQATERRIGETRRRPTLYLNGYTAAVGSLYAGMDLNKNY